MKIAYIAGPYRASTVEETVQNIQKAREVAAAFWRNGYAVICPHMNSALMDGLAPDANFLAGDREFIRRLRRDDVFVLLPGWERSEGTQAELAMALCHGLIIAEWMADKKRPRRLMPVLVISAEVVD